MKSDANLLLLNRALGSWRKSAYLALALGVSIFAVFCAIIGHDQGVKMMIFYGAIGTVMVVRYLGLSMMVGLRIFNRMVGEIRIDEDGISLATVPVSIFGGLLSRESRKIGPIRGRIRFIASRRRFLFTGKDLFNDFYVLITDDAEFLIVDNLFDDFEALKERLEQLANSPPPPKAGSTASRKLASDIASMTGTLLRVLMNGVVILVVTVVVVLIDRELLVYGSILGVCLFFILYGLPYIRGVSRLTRIIDDLSIEGDQVFFKTATVRIFGGLVRIGAKRMATNISLLRVAATENKVLVSGYDLDFYTVYSGKKEYYLIKDYFGDRPDVGKLIAAS